MPTLGRAFSVYGVQAMAENSIFSEAPASLNFRVMSSGGFEYQLTMRGAKVSDLLNQAAQLEMWLTKHGWQPARNGDSNGASPAGGSGAPVADAPLCPTHNKPMKPGQKGGWYCPAKIADDDGTGKPVYCRQKK